MRGRGLSVDARRVDSVHDADGYDAVVVGSVVYIGAWLKDAVRFVDRSRGVLSTRPLWLLSSGPISTTTADAEASDLRADAVGKGVAELKDSLNARDHRVFPGALDRSKLRVPDRLIAAMPAFPGSEGDSRDWGEIDAWSKEIAEVLSGAPSVAAAR